MFFSGRKRTAKPSSHAERVFKVGSELVGWPLVILLFAPIMTPFILLFLTGDADLPELMAVAVEYHVWLVAALVVLAILIIAGFFLQNAAFEVWDSAADSEPVEHIDG